MSSPEPAFDESQQNRLLRALGDSDYPERYLTFCSDFETYGDIDGPRLDLSATAKLFLDSGVEAHLDRKFKLFTFDLGEASGWQWRGKLVVQRDDLLEPMFEGVMDTHAVGSTMLRLARLSSAQRAAPMPNSAFFPPHTNRPRFDGSMATMARLVENLVALTRWMREVVARDWT